MPGYPAPMQAPMWPAQQSAARPRYDLIATMWTCTGVAVLCLLAGPPGYPLAFLLDVPALVCAIILVCSHTVTDKANGWVKIGLEVLAFISGRTPSGLN